MQVRIDLIKNITGHKGPIYAAAFSNKHQMLFSSGSDKLVACWNLTDGKNLPQNIRLDYAAYALGFSEAQQHLWIGCISGNIHVIDIEARQEIRNLAYHQSPIYQVKIDSTLGKVFTSDAQGYVGIWDLNSGKNLAFLKVSDAKIRFLEIVHNSMLLIGKANGSIEQLDIDSLNQIGSLAASEHISPVFTGIELHKKQTWLIGLKNGHIVNYHPLGSSVGINLPAHNFGIYSLISLLNEYILVSASRDKSMKIWNIANLEVLAKIDVKKQGHARSVNRLLKISESDFISVGDDAVLKHWRVSKAT